MEIASQIKNLKNIYDLLALCCEAVLLCPNYDYNNGASHKYIGEVDTIFSNYCIECKKSYKKQAFEFLKKEIVKYLNKGAGLDRVLAIALVIDNRIPPIITEKYSTADKWIVYQSLNLQYTNRIMVIPRKVKSFFDIAQSKKDEKGNAPFRKNREIHNRGIDYHIKNYQIRYAADLTEQPLSLYRASENSELYSRFSSAKELLIGLMPLTCVHIRDIFEIDCKNGKFEIQGAKPQPKEDLKDRYEATASKMPDRKLDFLIFPEMLMTDELMDYAKAHINPKAFITVNGSIWKECINKSIMTDFYGTEIFTYLKKALFEYHKDGKYYLEHLHPEKNKAYAILEIENFGRIGIAICKDLLEPDIRNMLRKINLNFLCVPAYSPSTDLRSEARELAEQTGCITVMVNSCGALENAKKEIGFICMPAKEGEDRSSVIKAFHNCYCYDNCRAGCVGKTVSLHLDKFCMHENKCSFALYEEGVKNEPITDSGKQ